MQASLALQLSEGSEGSCKHQTTSISFLFHNLCLLLHKQIVKNMIMSLTLKMKGGLRVRCVPLGESVLDSVNSCVESPSIACGVLFELLHYFCFPMVLEMVWETAHQLYA